MANSPTKRVISESIDAKNDIIVYGNITSNPFNTQTVQDLLQNDNAFCKNSSFSQEVNNINKLKTKTSREINLDAFTKKQKKIIRFK